MAFGTWWRPFGGGGTVKCGGIYAKAQLLFSKILKCRTIFGVLESLGFAHQAKLMETKRHVGSQGPTPPPQQAPQVGSAGFERA